MLACSFILPSKYADALLSKYADFLLSKYADFLLSKYADFLLSKYADMGPCAARQSGEVIATLKG